MFPAVHFDFTECGKQRARLGVVLNSRFRRNIGQWKNLARAIIFAADDAAGFIWCIALRLCDKLCQLVKSEFHQN